ncbi:helix-turn-helix domain-containing protein [Reichenbachiella sp.]|uniref:AraC family transcriptional regulator n=1 Tax=Reichenbachiella sp. TaxID=2184521 RepID=UPI003BAF108C
MPKQIDIRYHKVSFLKKISISTTSYHDHKFPKHFHDHYTIQLIEEGVNEGFTESIKYKIGKGGVSIINPGELHAGHSMDNQLLKFHTIRLGEDFIGSFYEQNEIPWAGDIRFDTEPNYDCFSTNKVLSLISNLKQKSRLEFESNLTELLMLLIKDHKYFKVQPPKSLKLAQEYLHANYRENLTLAQIAETCHLSPFHFLRQFKRQYGITPIQYLRNIRIEKAKMILSNHSVSQTAHQVGFYDHSHFLRHFKRIEGITPTKQFKIY